MPIPAAAIPAAARVVGSAATHATGRSAAKTGANSIAKTSIRSANSVCQHTGTTRLVTPKKIPSHLATPSSPVKPHSLPLQPFQNGIPNSQQMLNICNNIYSKADQLGVVDLTAELAANSLVQKMMQNKPKDFNPPSESTQSVRPRKERIVTPDTAIRPSQAGIISPTNGVNTQTQAVDFSASMLNSSMSVINQIKDLLQDFQDQTNQSDHFSEPTINLDPNGLRK